MRASVAAAIVAGSVVVSALAADTPAAQVPAKIDFARDVQPIFRQHCVGCHGPAQQMNGLRLDRRRDAMRGGTVAVIGPGNSEGSRLYLRVAGDRVAGTPMPPAGALKPEQVALIKAWIDEGAEWPDVVAGDTPVVPPDPIAQRLNDALRKGDRAAFTATLSRVPAAVRARGVAGITPLMTATLYADIETMQALLSRGADVNARNEAGATALMWAVADVAKTQLLVEHGAEIDARSMDGRTPLMIAAGMRGSAPVVKLLLDKGANPTTSGPSLVGATNPLVEAAFGGDATIFGLLVDAGVDLTGAGPVALAAATLSHCESCVDTLVKVSPPPFLSIAAGIMAPPVGDAELTRGLVERGADVNGRDPEGRPLIVAVASSDRTAVDTMQALLARGADVHAQGPKGETALDAARQRGQTPLVELLLKAGARQGVEPSAAPRNYSPADSPRVAVARSLPLLQRADTTFLRKAGCVSCHHNSLTAMTVATARQKGLPIDSVTASQNVSTIGTFLESWRERSLQNIGIPGDADTISYILLGLAAEGHPANAATDAMARFVKTKQLPDGHWAIMAHRPPLESSSVQVTAASMRSLQVYAPAVKRAEFDAAIDRAATWLKTAPVTTTEDRAFQILGLSWSRAGRGAVQAATRALLAEQHADGGWSQLTTIPSDAYATGQALVALAESGTVPATDRAFQRGVRFLLQTQLADGSWFVRSRAVPFQPQFDADFPHRKDSWISAAATNWATRALVYAIM